MPDPAKLVLITGGSKGIGAATAHLCAAQGWDVCITYRADQAAADAVVADCRSRGVSATSLPVDVASEVDLEQMFAHVDALDARLYGVVNNAGVSAPVTPFVDLDRARIERIFAINTIAPFVITREAVRRMAISRGGQGGAIVNVSSRSAELGSPGRYLDYAASKAALDIMTISVGREVGDDGVRVNSVRPGIIDTQLHAGIGAGGWPAQMAPNIPMRRPGQPAEIAEAIVWLLSERSSYVTAAVLDVSGGR